MKLIKSDLCLLSILFCLNIFAQKDVPSYGKIDKADLEMKDCDFDKGTAAVKLLHSRQDQNNF